MASLALKVFNARRGSRLRWNQRIDSRHILGKITMIRRLVYLGISLGMTSSCARTSEDISLAPEAQVLSGYVQAATCLALKASPEEKARLIAGMPFVDSHVTPADQESYLANMNRMVEARTRAQDLLSEVLPRRCPKSSRQVVFQSDQLDERTQRIYESHFAELVSIVLAIDVSSPEELRKFFEAEHAVIGIDGSTY